MIPILLQSHTRPLTDAIYNNDGDLLFTAAKDKTPSVWFAHNGERLGSLNGHEGAVWSLAVSSDSRTLLSGSADNTVRIWDVETGKTKHVIETKTSAKCVSFRELLGKSITTGNEFLFLTDATMGQRSALHFCDLRAKEPVRMTEWVAKATEYFGEDKGVNEKSKPTTLLWAEETIITGHEDGRLVRWDAKTQNITSAALGHHSETIRDMQWSRDRTYLITASKDTTARLFSFDLRPLKTYKTERPVNSASISPLRNEVLVAGGQEAIEVTTTGSRAGQFEARLFDQILEIEIGRIKGHFGPINTLTYSPDGRGYVSGGEDGYIRLHVFDPDYYALRTI